MEESLRQWRKRSREDGEEEEDESLRWLGKRKEEGEEDEIRKKVKMLDGGGE